MASFSGSNLGASTVNPTRGRRSSHLDSIASAPRAARASPDSEASLGRGPAGADAHVQPSSLTGAPRSASDGSSGQRLSRGRCELLAPTSSSARETTSLYESPCIRRPAASDSSTPGGCSVRAVSDERGARRFGCFAGFRLGVIVFMRTLAASGIPSRRADTTAHLSRRALARRIARRRTHAARSGAPSAGCGTRAHDEVGESAELDGSDGERPSPSPAAGTCHAAGTRRGGTVLGEEQGMTQNADDWADALTCSDCGAELWPDVDRAFASGPNIYLCFECAERRGGVYDSDEDRWTVAPDVSGIADERRPHP